MVDIGTLRRVIASSEYAGGETHPEGDSVQYRTHDGYTVTVHLSETFGDTAPSDEDVLRTAVRAGIAKGPTSFADAEEVTSDDVVETVAKVTAIGSSLGVYLTRELKRMGLENGDHVKVRLERI